MKVERTHVFDGEGHLCHYREVKVRTEDPYAVQPDLRCMGCGEYLEIADRGVLELMRRRLVGIVCPKCGKEQAAGPVSTFCMVDLGPGASGHKGICGRVGDERQKYWETPPDLRVHRYDWIDHHAMLCDACALLLEEAHGTALRRGNYERDRGPKDWSPKGEMPARRDV